MKRRTYTYIPFHAREMENNRIKIYWSIAAKEREREREKGWGGEKVGLNFVSQHFKV